MRIRMIVLGSGILATALLLTGCAPVILAGTMPGSPHGSGMLGGSDTPADVNAADMMFVQMMIPHHEQAIEMVDVLLDKSGIDDPVIALANQIKAAQGPEIELMKSWLDDWGVGEMPSGGHAMGDGMMSEDDMAGLEAAAGTAASRVFLEQMIVHHEGAIDMAEMEVRSGRNAGVIDLANAIITSQAAEIVAMRGLLGGD